jgi:DedD protein
MSNNSELYKDRVEVSLDGRQIFYLFFGGAVVTCMVFVLGVFVGKRVESRGHLDTVRAMSSDPLAALDRLDNGKGLSYRAALTQSQAAVGPVDREIADMAKVKADVVNKSARSADVANRVNDGRPAGKASEMQNAKDTSQDISRAVKNDVAKAAQNVVLDKSITTSPTETDPLPVTIKGIFTLQISSFQRREEAESFAQTVRDAGFKARIVEAKVDGKGTYYRVRSGAYQTQAEVEAARLAFEKKMNKSAIVSKM